MPFKELSRNQQFPDVSANLNNIEKINNFKLWKYDYNTCKILIFTELKVRMSVVLRSEINNYRSISIIM